MTAPTNLPVSSTPESIDWYTPQEVGQMAGGFSATFIRAEIKAGCLRAEYCLSRRRTFGRWRIRREDALAYIDNLRSSTRTSQSSRSPL